MAMACLGVIGICFIYSAQCYVGANFWLKQAIFLIFGAVLYAVTAWIDYRWIFGRVHYFYLASLALLLLLWTPLGEVRFNSRRWLDFGIFMMQPSEVAKVGVLLMVSSVLARGEIGSVRQSLKALLKVFFIIFWPFLLIFWQPDLGSALVLAPMVLTLLYISKLSQRFFAAVFFGVLLITGAIGFDLYFYAQHLGDQTVVAGRASDNYQNHSWLPLHDYQRDRLLTFLAPDLIDPQGTGPSWNVRQSLQAVGTGGWSGKGWTQGTQAQLGYLPRSVAHNDFIFSVLTEEAGFLGGLTVIGLYAVLIMNNLRIAGLAQDRFGVLLASGVAVILMAHIFINIGMTIGLMPVTGLPLPLLSYGGSFILSCCLLLGLAQSVYRHRKGST